ncbi:His-Xaa-Ser system protein HxsD [Pseudomonas sp. QE6]|uniref:His-Xaa-Ser system protein HxsD n=1 Tax=Pseudomonas sp. QE6 TaxID=3242491 RepID=UPI0035290240
MPWPLILRLDECAYSLSVVQRTAYAVARDYEIKVQVQDQQITLLVTPCANSINTIPPSSEAVQERVLQALNDFALRERIQQETAGLRELLIRAALTGCSS